MYLQTPGFTSKEQPWLSMRFLFEDWQRATAALKAAESRGADHAEIVKLSADVIRARNAVTLDRVQAGWQPPDDVRKLLTADDHLLQEEDDTTLFPT